MNIRVSTAILTIALAGALAAQTPPKTVTRPKPLTPVRTTPAPTKPDLCIDQLVIARDQQVMSSLRGDINPGQAIQLACYVHNLGEPVPAGVNWKVGFYIDGALVQTMEMMGGLSSGSGPLLRRAATAPQEMGVHYFECRLDMDNAIQEMDKRNNVLEIPFRVGATTAVSGDLPDLRVKDIALDGTRIVVWVQNVGGKKVNGVGVTLYVNDSPWGPAVYLGGTRYDIYPGDYLVFTNYYWHIFFDSTFVYKAVVAPDASVQESNILNNSMSVRFSVK